MSLGLYMHRCALVVGINDYNHNPKLINAVADAKAVGDVFEKLKYKVIRCIDDKTQKNDFDDALDEIYAMDKLDVVVLYFAGHGMQYTNSDYLVFSDAKDMTLNSGLSAVAKAIKVEDFYVGVRSQFPNAIVIAVIDACRRDYGSSSIVANDRGQGKEIDFGHTKLPYQTFIAFATSPYDSTSDGGSSGHSPYTEALLKEIVKENQSVESTFKNVRKKIYTGYGSHLPWEHSCLVDDFSFNHGQLRPHYGSPYFPLGFNKDTIEDTQGDFDKIMLQSFNAGIPTAVNSVIYPNHIIGNTSEEQFLYGRQLMRFIESYPDYTSQILNNGLFQQSVFNEIDTNHFLNGFLYELYFNPDDSVKEMTTSIIILDEVYRLSKNDKYSNSVRFIRNLLEENPYKFDYVIGKDNLIKYNLKFSQNEFADDDYNSLFILDKIHFKGKEMTPNDFGIKFPITKSELRNFLLKKAKVPNLLLSITENIELDDSAIIIMKSIDEVSVSAALSNRFVSGLISELDELGNHYEFEEIEDLDIENIQIRESDIVVRGWFNLFVTVYLSNDDDEINTGISFPGNYKIIIVDDEWNVQVNVDTSSYYH